MTGLVFFVMYMHLSIDFRFNSVKITVTVGPLSWSFRMKQTGPVSS